MELLLPVALFLLIIWIRTEITTKRFDEQIYVNSPDNNPTWFGKTAYDNAALVPPQFTKVLRNLCNSTLPTGLCPETLANATWLDRKEHHTGAAIDGLLLLHMALFNQALGVVGGDEFANFVEALPGYNGYVMRFSSQDDLLKYIQDKSYGYSTKQLFAAIHVNSGASHEWEIKIQMNATGPGSLDIQGATDVNTKLIQPTNPLLKGLSMKTTKIYWSGGLFATTGIPLSTGGIVDIQALVYSWIYNRTEAFVLPRPDQLPKCTCQDADGKEVEDFAKCANILQKNGKGKPTKESKKAQVKLLLRLLTPQWSTKGLSVEPGCLGRFSSLMPLSVREIPFPTEAYTQDTFAMIVKSVFGLFFVLVYLWPLTRIMKSFVEDKESKINEVMKMMGMPAEAITVGWYITYAILWLLPSIAIVVVCSTTVFANSNKVIVFLFFWLFGLNVVTFSSFMSVFFAQAKTASVVGALMFFLSYFPYAFVMQPSIAASSKMFSCICPPTALSFGAGLIAELESSGDGVQFGNLGLTVDNFSMGRVLFMMLFDVFFYAALAWYFDKVLVVGFGTRQSFFFCCTRRYWRPNVGGLTDDELRDLTDAFDDSTLVNPKFEPVNPAMVAQRSVLVRGLTKEFTTADGLTLKAVDNVTVNLYSNQIFCLLGHNGAGKTTTISMLSGMLPITSGDAVMCGKSVQKDMGSIRKILGVCPQHDVIWGMLTVREHLEFFAKLKAISDDEVQREVQEIIEDVSLQEKQNALASTLSGGQKRRLSAAISLIGGSKVVFLDEPSSGVDPFSRRELWDCLMRKKEGRTLILTTHFMDEAEQLGDRIAIMAAGQIKCVGTSLFLKSKYGVGYTLTIAKRANSTASQTSQLKELVQRACLNAEVLSEVGTEIAFRMPMDQSSFFPELFQHFEQSADQYGIEFFSVSVTTLEEVFLRVGQDHTQADMSLEERQQQTSFVRQLSGGRTVNTAPPSATGGRSAEADENDMSSPLTLEDGVPAANASGGSAVFFRHTHALLAKRFHNARRDKKAWCCQIAMPLIFLLVALFVMKYQGVGKYPPTAISISNLPGKQQLVYAANADATAGAKQFMDGIHEAAQPSSGIALNTTGFNDYLLATYKRSDDTARYGAYHFHYVPDWDKPDDTTKVQDFTVSSFRYPGKVTSKNKNFTVPVGTLWNETVETPSLAGSQRYNLSSLNNRLQVDLYWNSSARDAVPIFFHELHQQLLRTVLKDTGATVKLSNEPFPLTAGQKDLTDTSTSLNIALGFAFIPASFGAFVVLERETKSKHLQIVSGVNFISYWFATWLWDFINYLVPAVCSILLISAFGVESLISAANLPWTVLCVLFYGLSCSSFTYMLTFMFNSHTAAQNILLVVYLFTGGILEIVAIVLALIPSTKDLMRNTLIYIFRLLPNFCLADALTNLVTRTAPGIWQAAGCPMEGCAPSDLVICGWDLLYMGVGSLIWFGITLFLELALATPRLRAILRLQNVDVDTPQSPSLDPDVQAERERVESGAADEEMVVLKGLRKVYAGRQGLAPKVAVDDMYFGIPEGQCFGYLGMNGAGKTTTMKILTGEDLCTRGGATLGGYDVMTQQTEVRRLIGYCPQFDALIGTLTAREHLMLFSRIKGIPKHLIRGYVDRMLDRLTLTQFADRQASTFSGGTKRKLSLGIALVGNPKIVFLDEPTTGVDPESRRFMWKLISATMGGRSVILTTHSMDECEALCNRIGIMVNGRLVCLGTASHLKKAHGSGLRFEVTFKSGADYRSAFFGLSRFLEEAFPGRGARCIEGEVPAESAPEAFRQRVAYKLPKGKKPISAIFREVEGARERLEISEYSISETTLDQIFIHFAKKQWSEGEAGQTVGESIVESFSIPGGSIPIADESNQLPRIDSHPSRNDLEMQNGS